MKDIRVDSEGEFRCWNCGNKGLLEKRTFRSKMLIGVGALLTKKLKCQTCGEYNDTGNRKPYDGPESRKWRKQWEKIEAAKGAAQRDAEARQAQAQAGTRFAAALVAAAAEVRAQEDAPELSEPEPLAIEASTPVVVPPPPPSWRPDPSSRHEVRSGMGNGGPSTSPTKVCKPSTTRQGA